MKFCSDFFVFFELLNRVLRDNLPSGGVTAGVLFGETTENDGLQIETLAELYKQKRISYIGVSGFEGIKKSPLFLRGYEGWKEKLIEIGIPEIHLVRYELSHTKYDGKTPLPPCTDGESMEVIKLARERGWKSLAVVTSPFHSVRTFISMVTATRRLNPGLRVYNYPSHTPDWLTEVACSQSAPKDKRANTLKTELEKIENYCQKGDLLTAKEILEYLNQRNSF